MPSHSLLSFALIAFVLIEAEASERRVCSWVNQKQFKDFSKWGGFTLEYSLGRASPNAEFVINVVLE
jgi:hypothetical protein